MMQRGRQSAPIGDLVSDDGTDDGVFSEAPPDERLPTDHLLINPALPSGVHFRKPAPDEAPGPVSRGPEESLLLRNLVFQEWMREEGRSAEQDILLAVSLAAGLLVAHQEQRRPSLTAASAPPSL